MNKLLCIVGTFRSGTTALQRTLESSGLFSNFSEIFHVDTQRKTDFVEFCLREQVSLDQTICSRDIKNTFYQYLVYLSSLSKEKIILLDIKPHSGFGLRPLWSPINEPSPFWTVLTDARATILTVRRQDVFAQSLSYMVASHLSDWHVPSSADASLKLALDRNALLNHAVQIIESESAIEAYLRDYDRIAHFLYETLFDEAMLSKSCSDFLHTSFDLSPNVLFRSPINKIGLNYRDMVTNWAQLRDGFEIDLAERIRSSFSSRLHEAVQARSIHLPQTLS